jgi:hypothetical protein
MYKVTEKQNLQSERKGEMISAKNLTAAKRKASKMQCFHGTVMVISTVDGVELCYKKDGKWSFC